MKRGFVIIFGISLILSSYCSMVFAQSEAECLAAYSAHCSTDHGRIIQTCTVMDRQQHDEHYSCGDDCVFIGSATLDRLIVSGGYIMCMPPSCLSPRFDEVSEGKRCFLSAQRSAPVPSSSMVLRE